MSTAFAQFAPEFIVIKRLLYKQISEVAKHTNDAICMAVFTDSYVYATASWR